MDAATSAAVAAAIAAAGSAVAAFVSLGVALYGTRIQVQSVDFANCLEVINQLRDAMRRVHDAPDDLMRRFESIELLNLLEALALLYNDGKIAASTKKVTGQYLDEVLAQIRADKEMTALMRSAMTGNDTYRELQIFEKRHSSEIRSLARSYTTEQGLR